MWPTFEKRLPMPASVSLSDLHEHSWFPKKLNAINLDMSCWSSRKKEIGSIRKKRKIHYIKQIFIEHFDYNGNLLLYSEYFSIKNIYLYINKILIYIYGGGKFKKKEKQTKYSEGLEKKLDSNYTRMLRAILNKSWWQHPTRHQLSGHLPPIMKTIQVRRTRHAGHCWRSRDEVMYSYGPPHMAVQKQDDQHEHTFSNYVRIQDVVLKTCLRQWMIGKSVRDIRATSSTWWWWWYMNNLQAFNIFLLNHLQSNVMSHLKIIFK